VRNRRALNIAPQGYRGPWLLSLANGAGQSFNRPDEFVAALSKALTEANDIEQLFAIWERNVDTVRALKRQPVPSTPRGVIAENLVRTSSVAPLPSENRVFNRRPIPQQTSSRVPKSIRATSPLVSPSVFAQKNIFASSRSSHASSAVAPQPTPITSAMLKLKVSRST
jgi:hypothetical protein